MFRLVSSRGAASTVLRPCALVLVLAPLSPPPGWVRIPTTPSRHPGRARSVTWTSPVSTSKGSCPSPSPITGTRSSTSSSRTHTARRIPRSPRSKPAATDATHRWRFSPATSRRVDRPRTPGPTKGSAVRFVTASRGSRETFHSTSTTSSNRVTRSKVPGRRGERLPRNRTERVSRHGRVLWDLPQRKGPVRPVGQVHPSRVEGQPVRGSRNRLSGLPHAEGGRRERRGR